MTDLTDLFSPEELRESRIKFLERILGYYGEFVDYKERAKIVGHKIHGTGGNLGLKQFVDDGIDLQVMVETGKEEALILAALDKLKGKVEQALYDLRG